MDLSSLPGEQGKGINREKIESDREKYWEQFYEKYEELGAECASTVGIDEIDKPGVVEEGLRGIKRRNLQLPVSKTLRKWVKDHGEEIDELTTLAGPPSIDEEEISEEECESDCDDLSDLIDDNENIPEPDMKDHLPASPPSSPMASLVDPSDSESELLLYSSNLPTTTSTIFAPLSLGESLNFKEKIAFSPKLSSSRNHSFSVDPAPVSSNLNCSTCGKDTEYSRVLGLDESVFQCDHCMLEDPHPECGERCETCKRIAAELDARWIHRRNIQEEMTRGKAAKCSEESAECQANITRRDEDDKVENEKS